MFVYLFAYLFWHLFYFVFFFCVSVFVCLLFYLYIIFVHERSFIRLFIILLDNMKQPAAILVLPVL